MILVDIQFKGSKRVWKEESRKYYISAGVSSMNDLLELQVMATKLVHWPSGPTYACDHHAKALQRIGSVMRIDIAVEKYARDDADYAVNDIISNFVENGKLPISTFSEISRIGSFIRFGTLTIFCAMLDIGGYRFWWLCRERCA